MSGIKESKPDEANKSPEEMQRYTVLLFSDVPEKMNLTTVLSLIKGTDVLSIQQENTLVYITFFSYYELYHQWKKLGSEVTLEGCKIRVCPVETNLSDEERKRLHLAHAAGGTRNVMLSNLDDFMTGDFIREEAEKYGVVESLKHMRDRKVAYVEFYSFSSAIEFVVSVRDDSLFKNVKSCFAKDKCGSGEADDIAQHNNRTVYFGNIPADTTPSEILSVVQGGRVFMIKLIREKKCAFVGFFSYVSAAAFIEYSHVFSVCIRGMQIKLGPGKVQPLPHIAPILAYRGVTRTILLKVDRRSVNESKLEQELSRYGEIDKIEKKENGLVAASYLSAQDAYTAYQHMTNDAGICHMLCGYGEDPCETASALDLIMEVQKKEFMI
ncbi:hypothetical protein NEIG_02294 [Nematocida sp. ERTm5]|nr:hypothetical protein NEIRO02_0498 [Nematocida sp. AWRm79]KAI5182801.1 hypothetical protein NEIRO03_0443 [Nematocida sp. AWRm78]OAG33111.1 hypothetical protein NEIG_02294 [Nematocida sp. ERTm5]